MGFLFPTPRVLRVSVDKTQTRTTITTLYISGGEGKLDILHFRKLHFVSVQHSTQLAVQASDVRVLLERKRHAGLAWVVQLVVLPQDTQLAV